jgi:hypothetical protein
MVDDGGANPFLKVDGLCGPKTTSAIAHFQRRRFGWADFVIEPFKQTIGRLNLLMANVIQQPPSMADLIRLWGLDPDQVLPDISESFQRARNWILAARAALLSLSADALLERYFLIGSQASPDTARGYISFIFDQMQRVFARPGGLWGAQTFQPEPVLSNPGNNIAWCEGGGFYLQGQSVRAQHNVTHQVIVLRRDEIHVTWRFVITGSVQRSYAIVHELAHFVSTSPTITDNGYYHREPRAQDLPADQRLNNADCYAMLAYDAATGSSGHRAGGDMCAGLG